MRRLLPALLLGVTAGLSASALTADLAAQERPPAAAPPPAPSAAPQAAPSTPPQAAPPQAAPPAGPAAPPAPPGPAQPPPPGYGAPPPGYGAPPPGYGAPPPGYPYPPPGYPYPPPGYYYPRQPAGTPPADEPKTERRSTSMMVGGIVLTSAGGLALLFGSWLATTSGDRSQAICNEYECNEPDGSSDQEAGIALMATGAVGLGLGIVLWVRGAKRVPVQPAPSAALVVGPGRLSLQGQF